MWYNRDGKLISATIRRKDTTAMFFRYELELRSDDSKEVWGLWTSEQYLLSNEIVESDLFKAVYKEG